MRNRQTVKDIIFIFFCSLLFLFIFRSIFFNISTNLLDWFDYPYIVWVINHSVDAFRNLRIDGFFDSNIFYPNKGTFLFSDMLILPSIFSTIMSYLTKNIITSFNVIFFITLLLNSAASLFFWQKIFSQRAYIYFGVILTTFSPYVFLSVNHFQLINFWPMLFGMSFLFDKKISLRKIFLVGIIAGFQFLTAVYLSIFMLFAVFIWFALKLVYERTDKKLIITRLIQVTFFSCAFLITAGFFISKYIQVKNAYNIKRDYGEYVLYSAHISDYLFTSYYGSILSTSKLGEGWNRFNKHLVGESAGSPGLIIFILALIGILSLKKDRKHLSFALDLDFTKVYFLLLTTIAFVFSLGPRLNVNGAYTGIPLPYHLVMKIIPIVEPVRAPDRWMILFYLGLAYFAVVGLSKLVKRYSYQNLIIIGIGILFFLEIVPINRQTESKDYYPKVYGVVATRCQQSSLVLLEYPMTQFKKDVNILTNLTYRTQMMMASVNHRCNLVNGYHGYIPKDYEKYESELFSAIELKETAVFWKLITEKKISLIKVNKDELYFDRAQMLTDWLKINKSVKILFDNPQYLIVDISSVKANSND